MSAGRSPRRAARVAAVLGLVAVAGLATTAGAVWAQDPGASAGDHLSRVVQHAPIDGVAFGVHGGDEWLWVVNDSGRELMIVGYDEEPWWRIGPDGVFENRAAPSAGAAPRTEATPEVEASPSIDEDAAAEADWVRVADGTAHAWRDERIEPVDPGAPSGTVQDWVVPFEFGNAILPLFGEVRTVPGPPAWLWLLAALVLLAPGAAGWRTRPSGGRWPELARPAAVVLAVVAAVQAVHVVDGLAALPPGGAPAWGALAGTAALVVAGLAGAWRVRRGDAAAFGILAAAAAVTFLGVRLLLDGTLDASQLTSVWPAPLSRLAAAAGLVQALPLGAVAVRGTRRLDPNRATVEGDDALEVETNGESSYQ